MRSSITIHRGIRRANFLERSDHISVVIDRKFGIRGQRSRALGAKKRRFHFELNILFPGTPPFGIDEEFLLLSIPEFECFFNNILLSVSRYIFAIITTRGGGTDFWVSKIDDFLVLGFCVFQLVTSQIIWVSRFAMMGLLDWWLTLTPM